MQAEIHCPECGTFTHPFGDNKLKSCPRCGHVQAIILPEDHEIYARFKAEKEAMAFSYSED